MKKTICIGLISLCSVGFATPPVQQVFNIFNASPNEPITVDYTLCTTWGDCYKGDVPIAALSVVPVSPTVQEDGEKFTIVDMYTTSYKYTFPVYLDSIGNKTNECSTAHGSFMIEAFDVYKKAFCVADNPNP